LARTLIDSHHRRGATPVAAVDDLSLADAKRALGAEIERLGVVGAANEPGGVGDGRERARRRHGGAVAGVDDALQDAAVAGDVTRRHVTEVHGRGAQDADRATRRRWTPAPARERRRQRPAPAHLTGLLLLEVAVL